MNKFFIVLFELQGMFHVILDYNKLHLNKSFVDELSWIISHKVTWCFWQWVS